MKTFVIGDVHGRCAQLETLLEMLPRNEAADTVVFLGDLIDRGPDAPGCVDKVMKMSQANPERVLCLRGNHEQCCSTSSRAPPNLGITPLPAVKDFEQYVANR